MLSLFTEKLKNNAAGPGLLLCYIRPGAFSMLKVVAVLAVFLFVLNHGRSFSDIYKYKDKNGKWHFTNVKSDIRYKFYMEEARENPDAFIKKYDSIINQASKKFSLEPSFVKAVIKAESGFDHKAVSKKGAQGLMQLMPDTASEMAVDDPYNPQQNIFGGSRYLSKLMERYNNKLDHVLAAYNAGPERVDKYKGVPPFKETKTFIKRVMSYYKEFKSGE